VLTGAVAGGQLQASVREPLLELRVEGEVTLVRLVLVDTRARTVLFAGDLVVPGGAGVATGLATRMADLFLEP